MLIYLLLAFLRHIWQILRINGVSLQDIRYILKMNCNKLTSLILLAGVFTSTSCVEEKRPVPVRQRINVTPPSRESEAISQLTASIDDISADLDLIYSQERLLCKTTEHTNKRSKIIRQINALGALLAEKQKQIARIRKERTRKPDGTSGEKTEMENLYKVIDFLSEQLKEKSERVARLQAMAARKDVSVDQLRFIVLNRNSDMDALCDKLRISELERENIRLKAKRIMEQQRETSSEVYYIIARKQTLKEKGLLKTGFFSKKIDGNHIIDENFTKADRKELKTLTINSHAPKVLSANPEASYTLTENEDGTTTLTITNADKFWNVSRYLIIQD